MGCTLLPVRVFRNQDLDDATPESDNIYSDCYVLDIGVEIWDRADYIRMFKFSEEFYPEMCPTHCLPFLFIAVSQSFTDDNAARQYSLGLICVVNELCAKQSWSTSIRAALTDRLLK